MISPNVMNNCPVFLRDQQLGLVELVTREKVKNVVQDIKDNKDPRCDGFHPIFL